MTTEPETRTAELITGIIDRTPGSWRDADSDDLATWIVDELADHDLRVAPAIGDVVDHVDVFSDTASEWRWRAVAGNGRIVATSGEGYVNQSHTRAMATRLFPGVVILETDRG